jgi:phosphotransferase system enzyme I (PtsI)
MHPSHILSVKQQILHSELKALQVNSRKVLNQTDIEKIEPMIAKLNRTSDLSMQNS